MICQCSMTRSNCSSFCFRMHDLYFFSIRLNYQLESVRKRYLSIVYLLVQSGQPFSLRFVYTLLTCVIQNSASLTHIPCLTVSVFFPEDMTRNWNNIEIDVPVDWERWHFEFKLSVWEIRGRGIKKLIIRKVDRRTSCNIHDDVFKENASQIYSSCLLVESITDIPSLSLNKKTRRRRSCFRVVLPCLVSGVESVSSSEEDGLLVMNYDVDCYCKIWDDCLNDTTVLGRLF